MFGGGGLLWLLGSRPFMAGTLNHKDETAVQTRPNHHDASPPADQGTGVRRGHDLSQIYLVALLATVVLSFLSGVVVMWWASRGIPSDTLRHHAASLLRNWPMILPILAIALTVLIGRFVRWHFLLRCLNVRVPLGTSLLAFYAGVPMMLTPAYIGELVSAFVLNRLSGGSVFRGITAIIAGRCHDVVAILILLSIHRSPARGAMMAAGVVALAALGWLASPLWSTGLDFVLKALRRVPVLRWLVPASGVDAAMLLAPRSFVPCMLASLVGWYLISIVLAMAVLVAGQPPDYQACSRIFLEGVLYGAKHLSPGGIGYTSHYMWHTLVQRLGMNDMVALEASTLTRFTITGLTILVGGAAFLMVVNRHRRLLAAADRFDALSARYDEEMARHVMDLLLERKTRLMRQWLIRLFGRESELVGVDIGCGTGGYAARMVEACGSVIALDAAEGQVRQAAGRSGDPSVGGLVPEGVPGRRVFMTARLPHLPIADASVDFAYSINVLHHLTSRAMQREALAEIARVLKPGGVFFLHEINTINPLFRFYMGYIFPVLHAFDDGTELWLTPQNVDELSPIPVIGGEYFTFLPEFAPRLWQATLGFLERWLEQSRLRRYSAHYMLVCRKPGA